MGDRTILMHKAGGERILVNNKLGKRSGMKPSDAALAHPIADFRLSSQSDMDKSGTEANQPRYERACVARQPHILGDDLDVRRWIGRRVDYRGPLRSARRPHFSARWPVQRQLEPVLTSP